MITTKLTAKDSNVRTILKGKRVLISGSTGFLGKVVLEKIIREVPDIGAVYLLIRGNSAHPNADDRFRAEILSSSIFDLLRETRPQLIEDFCHNKLTCIGGEITQENFALDVEDYVNLANNTDAFINSAASVNFHEELDKALKINTLCLNNIVDFAAAAGDIPVIQISTCYVNGYNKGNIPEGISPPVKNNIPLNSCGYYDIFPLLSDLQSRADVVRRKITDPDQRKEALIDLGIQEANRYGWGDTYTFTKWLGEQLLLNRLNTKTLTILRPSVVESALESPKPGWIEGVKVADAILLAYARQKVSFFPARKAGIVDIIPVDLVANSVLLSLAEACEDPRKIRIYQCCSGTQNPLVVKRYVHTICEEVRINWKKYPKLARKQPVKKFMLVNRQIFLAAIRSMKLFYVIMDRLKFRGAGQKSKALKVVESTLKLSSIYSYYTSPKYIFNSDRLMALADRMGDMDKQLFPVDAQRIDWEHYFQNVHVAGLNHYGMEDRSKVEQPPEEPAVDSKTVSGVSCRSAR